MARRNKKSGLFWAGVPYGIGIIAGAALVSWIEQLRYPWHLLVPWSLAVTFFVFWRVTARRKVVRVQDETGSQPKVKRLV